MSKTQKHIQALSHPDKVIRREAARKLGRPGNREAVEPLCRALADESWYVRRNAAVALGRIGDAWAVEPLIAALNDRTVSVRREAITALGLMRSATAVDSLCLALSDKKQSVQLSAMQALVQIGRPAIGVLCQRLVAKEARFATLSLRALKNMLDSEGVSVLYAILANRQLTPQERWTGLDALRGHRKNWFTMAALSDVRPFCEQARQFEDVAIREGAQTVLDYLMLGRASQRSYTTEKEDLLRAASGSPTTSGADILLRATAEVELAEKVALEDISLFGRLKQLFQKLKRLFRRNPSL